jgi:hypothetical protein
MNSLFGAIIVALIVFALGIGLGSLLFPRRSND